MQGSLIFLPNIIKTTIFLNTPLIFYDCLSKLLRKFHIIPQNNIG